MILDQEERIKHLTMIRTPEDWPRWPILPLKRWGNWEQTLDGLLLADSRVYDPHGQIWVLHFNMFMIPTIEKNGHRYLDMDVIMTGPHTVCEDADAVLDLGWKVD
jgi:hypothetical protein